MKNILCVIAIVFVFWSCGGGGGGSDDDGPGSVNIPDPENNLTALAFTFEGNTYTKVNSEELTVNTSWSSSNTAAEYELFVFNGEGTSSLNQSVSLTTTSIDVVLEADNVYTMFVRAYDEHGHSRNSEEVTIETPSVTLYPPNTPTINYQISGEVLSLNWSSNDDDGYITGYQVSIIDLASEEEIDSYEGLNLSEDFNITDATAISINVTATDDDGAASTRKITLALE